MIFTTGIYGTGRHKRTGKRVLSRNEGWCIYVQACQRLTDVSINLLVIHISVPGIWGTALRISSRHFYFKHWLFPEILRLSNSMWTIRDVTFHVYIFLAKEIILLKAVDTLVYFFIKYIYKNT